MCGITGIFDTQQQRPIDKVLLLRMNDSQNHRGPDQDGVHIEPGVGLGHKRLSIIDVSSGQQPMYNADDSVVIVYNGEVYNFRELTEELKAAGYTFKTHSDTEAILHAWEAWGEACVDRLRGMFVFAIWDRKRQTLFLARDRLGIKPLYYSLLPDGHLLFGSELKSLMAHPGLQRETNPYAIEDYFAFGYIPDPKTIFNYTFKLAPGHTLSVKKGQSLPPQHKYWDVPFQALPAMDEPEMGEELIARLREAVDIRLVAEVPLGAFLSGGVDSSAVVAMMAGLSSDPVNTCSISFGDPAFNESRFAHQVATQYQTSHSVEQVDPEDFDLVGELSTLYDEPYADSSALPTYRLCQLARRNVTVALSGDGGDENLAGYRRYRWHTYEEMVRGAIPRCLRRPLFGALGNMYPKADWAPKILRAKSTFQAIARDSVEGYFHGVSILGNDLRARLFSNSFKKQLGEYRAIQVFADHIERAPTDHPLSLVQYLDMKTYLPGDILTKVDRASMSHSLEVRVPLLDHKLVEWISGISPQHKLRGREGKYIFKKSLESHLSNDILYRPKMGFGVPLASWFRGPLRQKVRDSLLGSTLAETGIFDQRMLTEIVNQHQSGRRDYSPIIWALFMFESFQQRRVGEAV